MILKAIGKADGYIAATTAEIRAAIDDPRPSIPHEEAMAEMEAEIVRLKEGNSTKHTAQQTP